MKPSYSLHLIIAISLLLCLASWAWAKECFCSHCGRGGTCQKICRLVCENKKVEVVCWGCVHEDFCLPCPGKKGCEHCELVCEECDCDPETPQSHAKKFVWSDWLPTRAKMFMRAKLMKKTITKEVPSYKWVVEDLCPHCQERCDYASVKSETELPPIPVADATVLYGTTPEATFTK